MEIGIVSAGRPEVCAAKTLTMLREGEVPREAITVFVPSSEERDAYREASGLMVRVVVAPHDPYDRSLPGDRPSRGLATARNYALREMNDSRWVWWFDDDLTELRRMNDEGKGSVPVGPDLYAWMQAATEEGDRWGCSLVGILPSANSLTMSATRTVGLSFCIGQAFATRYPIALGCETWLAEKDDYERSIRHYVDGTGCYRLNDVCPVSKVYKGDGGLQLSRTYARSHAEARWLMERWPRYVRLNRKRTLPVEEGRAEILIVPQRGNEKIRRPYRRWADAFPR